jgi:hypothetical protein
MRILCLTLLALISASAQSPSAPWFVKNEAGRIGISPTLRFEPPTGWAAGRFTSQSRGRSITNGPTFYSRILLDKANRVYFGYELLVEQKQPGAYLATFGKLGVSALDLAAGSIDTPERWTMQPLPAIPDARLIHDGETISVDLFVDAAQGLKLIDDIRINPPGTHVPGSIFPANRATPVESGAAHDFAATDAELLLVQPLVTLNRRLEDTVSPPNVHGLLVWLYLPDHGRYVLSLLPRSALGFKKAGEVRGGVIAFSVDGDSIRLECPNRIAPGGAPYNLYVLRDKDWEPISEDLKDHPATGTVSPAELAALK